MARGTNEHFLRASKGDSATTIQFFLILQAPTLDLNVFLAIWVDTLQVAARRETKPEESQATGDLGNNNSITHADVVKA